MAEIYSTPPRISWDRLRGWRDQYDRMQRWHARLLRDLEIEAAQGNWSTWPDDLWDTAVAFFQSAYHLKDWIVRDFPELRQELNSTISSNPGLAICADICNGTKHGHVDRNHRVPAHVVGMREFAPELPSGNRWLVRGPDGPINLEVLANDVLSAWEILIGSCPQLCRQNSDETERPISGQE